MLCTKMLSTGHHWHRRDPDFLLYDAMVRNVFKAIKSVFRGSHVILRSTPWGHIGCEHLKSPFNTMSQAWEALSGDVYQVGHVWLSLPAACRPVRASTALVYLQGAHNALPGPYHR